MTVDDWVLESVRSAGGRGLTLRQIQRRIDEIHGEELAVDTIETALAKLVSEGKLESKDDRWQAVRKTSREDALKKLFGE